MSDVPSAIDLLGTLNDFVNDPSQPSTNADRPVRLATVDPAYTPGAAYPKVTFDGEATMSGKGYPYTGDAPLASARVVMLPTGARGYLIVGAVSALTRARAYSPTSSKLFNGDGRINQRAAASGASLASGAYFLDRWKSNAATNAVTWTGSDTAGRVLTIPASKSIVQVLEQADMPADAYTLAWTGTAQARVYNSGGSTPAYASSPVTVTTDGTANVVVEVGPGTFSKAALWVGTVPYPFVTPNLGDELRRCQRYFVQYTFNGTAGTRLSAGFQQSTTAAYVPLPVPVPMRAGPTATFSGLAWTDTVSSSSAVSAVDPAGAGWNPGQNVVNLIVTIASYGAQSRPGAMNISSASAGFLALSAEL